MSLDFATWLQIQQLYGEYASVLDAGQWDRWPDFFVDDCVYRIQPRENHERGFPLATLSLTSKGMLKDRVYGIQETLYLTSIPGMKASIIRGLKTPAGKCAKVLAW